MSSSDHDFDIATALGRIEAKLDILNSTISKVMYGLLAIVAAVVGVEFLPNSPIDWMGATDYGIKFLMLVGASFGTINFFGTRNEKKKTNNGK